jgi:hypothetical protein
MPCLSTSAEGESQSAVTDAATRIVGLSLPLAQDPDG